MSAHFKAAVLSAKHVHALKLSQYSNAQGRAIDNPRLYAEMVAVGCFLL
jgi:hypothetical protein